jgi:hypothetical protein
MAKHKFFRPTLTVKNAELQGTLAATGDITARADVNMSQALVFSFTAGSAVTTKLGVVLGSTAFQVEVPTTDEALVPIGICQETAAAAAQTETVTYGVVTAESDGSGTTITVGSILALNQTGQVVVSASATANVVGRALEGSQTVSFDIKMFVDPTLRA